MRSQLREILTSRTWENFIIVLIVLTAIILGLMTSGSAMEAWGTLLLLADKTILVVFVIEIALRITVHGWRFFRDPWSLFDFFVVAVALVPAGTGFEVLRALRVLRVLRLVTMVPSLRRVVGGLLAALPGMGSIVLLMAIIFYVFSVMATKLYGATFPDWFGTVGASMYSLFQIMTLESWSMGIVRPVMETHPTAWLFFVPFIMVTTFAVLNLFIGIIVSGMQSDVEAAAEASRGALADEQASMASDIRALRAEVAALSRAMERLAEASPSRSAGVEAS